MDCRRGVKAMTTERNISAQKNALSRARSLLGADGNRVKLIVGLLICVLATVTVLLIVSALSLMIDFEGIYATSAALGALVEVAFMLIQLILVLLLAFPLYLGLFSAALRMRRGEPFSLGDLFMFFDSPAAYLRGWGITVRVVGRAFPYLILYGLSLLAYLLASDVFYGLVGIAAAPLVILGLYTTGRSFPFVMLALCNPGASLKHTMINAIAMTRKKTLSILVFRMRLLWRFLLSLVSIGVVTLFHVLPLMILADNEYAFELVRSQPTPKN